MNLEQMLDFFFRDPADEPTFQLGNNLFSNLYLLRRDINTCYDGGAIWPGVMGIMAGIDLLAKFHAGKDKIGEVGDRFKAFVDEYLPTANATENEVIYQLRNSMLHSFGLYSKRRAVAAERNAAVNGFDRQDYAFRLTGDNAARALITLRATHPIQTLGVAPDQVRILSTDYDLHVHALRTGFDAGIRRYQRHLETQNDLRNNFATHANTDINSFFNMYAVTNMPAIAVQIT